MHKGKVTTLTVQPRPHIRKVDASSSLDLISRPIYGGEAETHTKQVRSTADIQIAFRCEGVDPDCLNWPTDTTNEEVFQAYLQRQTKYQQELKQLYEETPKLEKRPLPPNTNYIRPFLSSTFRDFQEERNVLFKSAFPRIEKLSAKRGMFFAPLDLRWGLTSSQSSNGQVIKICLDEIERSRPYFVCSLGFRNGWALGPNKDALLEDTFRVGIEHFPWIESKTDRSVTELEILHGALNDPSRSPRSFFYFRDVSTLSKVAPADRSVYAEVGYAELKLRELKRSIIKRGYKVQFFDSPEDMAHKLEADLTASIEEDFPVLSNISGLDQELRDHQSFAEVRVRVYVKISQLVDKLEEYMLSPEPGRPIVITGVSGAGKSTLLANWLCALKERARQGLFKGPKQTDADEKEKTAKQNAKAPGVATGPKGSATLGPSDDLNQPRWNLGLFLDRYIGASSDSCFHPTLLRWLMQEIKMRQRMTKELSVANLKQIKSQFPEWLEEASSQVPILLALDGLDQMDKEDWDLGWLPDQLPKSVRLVVSCLKDTDAYRACKARQYQEIVVEDLTQSEVDDLTQRFLAVYGKTLDNRQKAVVQANPLCRNPLYLTTFLQEVRTFGSYEALNAKIDHYMLAKTTDSMFAKVLERLEEDFSSTPDLVRNFLSLLMVSREGLNERELKESLLLALKVSDAAALDTANNPNARMTMYSETPMAGVDAKVNKAANDGKATRAAAWIDILNYTAPTNLPEYPFPQLDFGALLHRLDRHLVTQRGMMRFSHDYLRKAVKLRYFSDSEYNFIPYHCLLATYFSTLEATNRKAYEMPWHISENCLLALKRSREAKAPASANGNNSSRRAFMDFNAELRSKRVQGSRKPSFNTGSANSPFEAAVSITEHSSYEEACRSFRISASALNRTLVDMDLFELLKGPDHMMHLHQYWTVLQKGLSEDDYVDVHIVPNSYSVAVEQWNAESSSKKGYDPLVYADKCQSIGTFLMNTERHEGADQFLQKALDTVIRIKGEKDPKVEQLLSSQGDYFYGTMQYAQAFDKYTDSLRHLAMRPGEETTESVLRRSVIRTQLAGLLKAQGRFKDALGLYEQSLEDKIIAEGTRKALTVAVSINNVAELHMRMLHPEKALPLYEEALKIVEDLRGSLHPEVSIVLSSMGACYTQTSPPDLAKALAVFDRARRIKEASWGPDHVAVAVVLNNLASAYHKTQQFDKAIEHYERCLSIHIATHGEKVAQLAPMLNNIGMVYQDTRKFQTALEYFKRALSLQEQSVKDPMSPELVYTLALLKSLLLTMTDYSGALEYATRELRIQEKTHGEESAEILPSLNFVSLICQKLKLHQEAKVYVERSLAIQRKIYKEPHIEIARHLYLLGRFYVSSQHDDDARVAFRRCLDMYAELKIQEDAEGYVKRATEYLAMLDADDESDEGDDEGDLSEEEAAPRPAQNAQAKSPRKLEVQINGTQAKVAEQSMTRQDSGSSFQAPDSPDAASRSSIDPLHTSTSLNTSGSLQPSKAQQNLAASTGSGMSMAGAAAGARKRVQSASKSRRRALRNEEDSELAQLANVSPSLHVRALGTPQVPGSGGLSPVSTSGAAGRF